jgi:hypothetical protein
MKKCNFTRILTFHFLHRMKHRSENVRVDGIIVDTFRYRAALQELLRSRHLNGQIFPLFKRPRS